MNHLFETRDLGQQIWLDNLSRSLTQTPALKKLIGLGVAGVTTNPAIFAEAIAQDPLYLEEIKALKEKSLSAKERYERLATVDVTAACDAFSELYHETKGDMGFVSIELDPNLASDLTASVKEAGRLWETVNRPNLMIKVPMNGVGVEVFAELIRLGMNVNATLLFSRAVTKKIYHAYHQGILTRLKNKEPVQNIRAVASFFLSRVDTALDPELPPELQGQTAIHLARAAYRDWQQFIRSPEGKDLREHEVKPPRLLWASTSTKNPRYSDTLYVDELIGPHTVNTLAEATLRNFLDHGKPALTLEMPHSDPERELAKVEALGVDLEKLATRLQEQGLEQFKAAFEKILAVV